MSVPLMFKNYLLCAWRAILREPMFAAINAFGLAVGLACCILMLLFVRHETRYDTTYDHADRLYQASVAGKNSGVIRTRIPGSLLSSLEPVPGGDVEAVAAYTFSTQPANFTAGNQAFSEEYLATTPNFFRLMDRPFLAGNADGGLSTPQSVVITRSLAQRLFGTEQALGRTLITEKKFPLTVQGVIADFPRESHIRENVFVSYAAEAAAMRGMPTDLSDAPVGHLLIRLSPAGDITAVTEKLNALYTTRATPLPPFFARLGLHIETRPLSSIHLDETALQIVSNDGTVAGSLTNQRLVTIATFLAGLVLLIAIVNFLNMMVARSQQRRREIATRKALGAGRGQLRVQYLLEAMLLTVIALAVALALVEITLPGFRALVDRPLTLEPLFRPEMLAAMILLVGAVGLLAGAYPAWVLSGLPAIAPHAAHAGRRRLFLRQALVFGQFFVTSLLIAVALTARGQLGLFHHQDFDKDVYVAQVDFQSWAKYTGGDRADTSTSRWTTLSERIRNELIAQPAIANVSGAGRVPGTRFGAVFDAKIVRSDVPDAIPVPAGLTIGVDERFLDTFSLPLLAGRGFSAQRSSDRSGMGTDSAILLTAAEARKLGFPTPRSALGAQVRYVTEAFSASGRKENGPVSTVIGVTGDMLMGEGISAAPAGSFFFGGEMILNFVIKPEPGQGAAAAQQARETLKRVAPQIAVEVSYLPDTLERSLRPFSRLMAGFFGYALLAIVISCLGLYAMTTFVVARRAKEVGVRKVLGAGGGRLTGMLSWDLTRPVVIALVLALPFGRVLCDYILQPFVSRVSVGFSILGLTAAIALVIAWATVLRQSAKLASTPPCSLLRHE